MLADPLVGHWSARCPTGYNRCMSSRELLGSIERYYDEVPRASATAEDIGPIAVEDVHRVLRRQRELGAPQKFEWVHENAPELDGVLSSSGLEVEEHPLMVLDSLATVSVPEELRLRLHSRVRFVRIGTASEAELSSR